MTRELLSAFLLVFVAEMGDKTQILAMMFATRYKARSVLAGVFIGSLLNHGLAVLLGNQLGCLIPLTLLGTIAGLAFIYFAFTSLRYEEGEKEELINYKSPIITVASAFFIGELGDKTQLAAITLSMDAVCPWEILIGTVGAMVATSVMGIWVGSKIGKNIPDIFIKTFSAALFFVFGIIKLSTLFWNKVDTLFIVMEAVVISAAFIWTMIKFIQSYYTNKSA
ncbi:TMEM165/GDT1 family protein [Cellulosilyticum sp. I15G10I2]|uniref:TMEM165/GDT1 family protein n=1 Tax=Cellulosilyticum sp. I15G10I2 TaxID=1892843 RepID=UPI00085C5804|nr:TMEM165/GDT1 family protein [Cellulosilyticum sp. I15G10I2]